MLVDSVDCGTVKPAIALAMATFDAYRRLRNEADKYRNQLDSRKQIDHAKNLLMRYQKLSEPEAHCTLRKMAMDRNQKLPSVAADVIEQFRLADS